MLIRIFKSQTRDVITGPIFIDCAYPGDVVFSLDYYGLCSEPAYSGAYEMVTTQGFTRYVRVLGKAIFEVSEKVRVVITKVTVLQDSKKINTYSVCVNDDTRHNERILTYQTPDNSSSGVD